MRLKDQAADVGGLETTTATEQIPNILLPISRRFHNMMRRLCLRVD